MKLDQRVEFLEWHEAFYPILAELAKVAAERESVVPQAAKDAWRRARPAEEPRLKQSGEIGRTFERHRWP